MGYTDYNTFLMFGDSITEYAFDQYCLSTDIDAPVQFTLGPALQNIYQRKLQIIQRGFSGYNSRDAVPLAKSILKTEHDNLPDSKKIKIAYMFFGTNDARLIGNSPLNNESMPLERFIPQMKEAVKEFTSRNIPLIVIAPGVHVAKDWDKSHPDDLITGDYRTNERNKLYQDTLKEIITDVPVLGLYDLMMDWINEKPNERSCSDLLCDGIHFSGKGYKLMFDALLATIKKHYPECHPDNLPYRFPYHADLKDDTFANID